MEITIEAKEIEAGEGMSVLDAALAAGIYIPHLCKHPDLEAVGGCRLCSVEVHGLEEPVPACKTIVQEGMTIKINSPKADKVRKMAMELILATHPADCTGCPKYGKCELQSMYQYMGVSPERWRKKSRSVANDDSNPLIRHLFTRCVRCGRCIRACRELRGVKVLDYQRTKDGIRVGIDGGVSLKEAGCKFCGACIEVCPTGSIMDAIGIIKDDRPYTDSVVPCRSACPAKIDIPRYIRYIKKGDLTKALAVIREEVPFPGILGSVCVHDCETDCKRNMLGNPISVCKLKRVAAIKDDGSWKRRSRKAKPTGKQVAVIGGGPAGLTAAYYLVKKGHTVTVFEENAKAGGQCRYGIPAYRLSDELIDKEIADVLEVGVKLFPNTKVDNPQYLLKRGFDAVLIAIGTHKGIRLSMEGNGLAGVYVNADFLKRVRLGALKKLDGRIMVLGGGSVAYDCARTAVRLGAKEVHIACLEALSQMTATKDEILEGEEEGIILHAGYSFLNIIGDRNVTGVTLQKIERFYFDENRKPIIQLGEGSNEVIPVEQVIFAVGQKPAGTELMGVELVHNSYIKTDEKLATSVPGIYAAGDVVTGTKSVIAAIAAGRKSAEEIDKFLGGDGDISEQLVDMEITDPFIGRQPGFADLEKIQPECLEPYRRKCSFEIVEKPFTSEMAEGEASRCLQCDLRLHLKQPKLWNEY